MFCAEQESNFISRLKNVFDFKEGDELQFDVDSLWKDLNAYIDSGNNDVIPQLMFLYTSNNVIYSKGAAFFLGLFDYYGVQVSQSYINAKRFFKYAAADNENPYIRNWAFFYLGRDKNEVDEWLPLFKKIDMQYLNKSHKKIVKTKMENYTQDIANKYILS